MKYQKRYFGYRAEFHPSKKLAFGTVCSGCFKPLKRNSRNKIGYICRKCGPLYTRKPEQDGIACKYCPFEEECTMRVSLGIWLRCETPDFADLERLKRNGGLNDEKVRTTLDITLVGSGSRKILEEAITQSAPKIYQSIIKGKAPKMSVGIRE